MSFVFLNINYFVYDRAIAIYDNRIKLGILLTLIGTTPQNLITPKFWFF